MQHMQLRHASIASSADITFAIAAASCASRAPTVFIRSSSVPNSFWRAASAASRSARSAAADSFAAASAAAFAFASASFFSLSSSASRAVAQLLSGARHLK